MLDRSRVRRGQSHPEALRETVEFGQLAEEWGYHRFWVSEHHSVPGVAGSAPTVLAAAVAGATSRIRVGTGGVMLPNHQPLVVAEQFGVLESLFPGRIDMGLGRSVGFTGGVRRALGHGKDDADDVDQQLTELLDYFSGGRQGVHAWPAEGLRVPAFLLAIGSGADRAARFGLPLVIAAARGEDAMVRSIEQYRTDFRATRWGSEPVVIVSGSIVLADTAEQARRLLMPEAWAAAYSRTRGEFPVLIPPEDIDPAAMTERERQFFDASMQGHLAGTEETVAEELERLLDRTGADEFLVHTSTYDRAARLESHRRLARLVGLAPSDRLCAPSGDTEPLVASKART
ncbi:luciferase family oxidoreductase group 1 [Nocardia transvalensis]|uniref:Luciferase family oxidoreductase group 1 n=1 Tax=Nocardia transvalensis TaxID=37333 RepID=A0A7W9PMK5_9NOCA|nr:LLM class flavin-dependent oxidoreductase [Nocardia transvalensis]MBB5918846.1 luciferase family oxidoreductase group 1 [Nocardia transvalensis]